MTLDIRAVKDNEARAPHRILPVFSGGGDFAAVLPERWRSLAQETARIREFTGKTDTTLLLAYGAEQWLLTGLGEPAALTAPRFSEALARAYSELSRAGAREITVCLPPGLPWQPRQTARLAGEALHMAGYAFRYYRSRESGPPAPSVELLSPAGAALADVETGLREALAVGRGIDLTRDLINHPAAVATPGFVRDQAQTLAKELGLGFKVIQGEELAELGYGAIYAVGRGAENPPCLVALEYGQ
ncbi:MAG: hypothetical protein OEW39_06710, partial [Deltaproteobacteria bacterium]|nr:hypothetical protein [Deltaproteobacteria bacterium]